MTDTTVAISKSPFAFGITLKELYSLEGLKYLDKLFLDYLWENDRTLRTCLDVGRASPELLSMKQESSLLVKLAPLLQDFLCTLFGIMKEVSDLSNQYQSLAPLYTCKRLFIQRRVLKTISQKEAETFNGHMLEVELEELLGNSWTEVKFARSVMNWLSNEKIYAFEITTAARYAAWRIYTRNSISWKSSVLFQTLTSRVDIFHLLGNVLEYHPSLEYFHQPFDSYTRCRTGFDLTDQGLTREKILDEVNYCIFCHHRNKDSCVKGIRNKQTGNWVQNAFSRRMIGCPLGERISEFHETLSQGNVVAALALITIDNPMVAGTGHRICNDCMISCIYSYQGRTAVNIPQTETRVVRDVLALPYGFEVYSLLTRWNPLNLRQPLPHPKTGRTILVVGLGPSGYTLAHYLLNAGHTVVAIDGSKIEPLPSDLSGVTTIGTHVPFNSILDIASIWEPLSARVIAGFGGVAEYGITVRWEKNFLKIIRLLLERRMNFSLFGGVRMGGTITPDSAFSMGFNHIALCSGAGQPTVVPMENGLARGVRQASDFLMALQLTGASKIDSLTNLQIRLPIVVIGGGLTAIDVATEALTYYLTQVDKFFNRYKILTEEQGEKLLHDSLTEEEELISVEFLKHAKILQEERIVASMEARLPRFIRLLQQWGGVTLIYRRRLIESPAYRGNPEEVNKALEEGVRLVEGLTPFRVDVDRFGHAVALRLLNATGQEFVVPARTIIIAAGTTPNITLSKETRGLQVENRYFRALDQNGNQVEPERSAKPSTTYVLTTTSEGGDAISFFGDQHPSFLGNVVSAMASSKYGYPVVNQALAYCPRIINDNILISTLNRQMRPIIHSLRRLTPKIIEVTTCAPLAVSMFNPGQFYRFQNYETLAHTTTGTLLSMEGLALTGAWTDKENGLLSMVVLEVGGSSDLISCLHPGEPVIVMGPTGLPTQIPTPTTVLLVGGGLGNAVLLSIGYTLRKQGARTLYFAAYKSILDRYEIEKVETASDCIVWCCEEAPGFIPDRKKDKSFVGTITSAVQAYAEGQLGETPILLDHVDYILAVGSDGMMDAVRTIRHGMLSPYLSRVHTAIGSINAPMQCMMKEICAQCLQRHYSSYEREKLVFSCANQDQLLDSVDFYSLHQRLLQQSLQEKLTKIWIDRCLVSSGYRPNSRTTNSDSP